MLSSCRIPVAWLSLLLLASAAAGDAEKDAARQDTCSPSLLQISSSVHEPGHADRILAERQAAPVVLSHRSHLTLLQVAARTGEVSQYKAHEEDSLSESEEEEPKAITPERRRELASLLAQGGSKKVETSKDASEQKEKAALTQKSALQAKASHDEESKEDKPDAKELQGARIAPFGKEDTGRELQHHAARTQDTLVDAIENAEVAEIKRSIFRSLTRLRAAEIKEFDTIARLETQAIDEYNDNHHYRAENPLDYIHGGEAEVKQDKYTSFHD